MNELTIKGLSDQNQLAHLQDMFGGADNSDLNSGVSASFPVVSFKGKVWRVKFKGEEKAVLNADGDPVASLHAVIVKASPAISKIYYKHKYTEGDDSAPTCFSVDGVRPDPGAEEVQSETCAACPHNVWGSRITENGNKTKACADSRRVAIVPYPDLRNEQGGGPMLLRIPPASLQNLVKLSEQLNQLSLPYQAVVVKIHFDHEVAFPKLLFTPAKALSAEEAVIIKEHMESESVNRMFSMAVPEEGAANTATRGEGAKNPMAPPPDAALKEEPEQEPERPAQQADNDSPKEKSKPSPKEAALDEGDVADDDTSEEIEALLADVLGD